MHLVPPSKDASVRLAKQAEKDKADAIASASPYYYLLDEASIVNHFSSIAKFVSLPLFVCYILGFTTNATGLSILRKLKDGRMIIGMKDSSKDYLFLASVIQEMQKVVRSWTG